MVKTKCKRCQHEWNYLGNRNYSNCPLCRTTVKVQNLTIEELIIKRNDKQ